MRQAEIFPLVVDQKHIEEYINTQNELVKWKKASRKFRKHVNDWKNTFRIAQSLIVKRKGTKISEISGSSEPPITSIGLVLLRGEKDTAQHISQSAFFDSSP